LSIFSVFSIYDGIVKNINSPPSARGDEGEGGEGIFLIFYEAIIYEVKKIQFLERGSEDGCPVFS
jgi:hypothetical protein